MVENHRIRLELPNMCHVESMYEAFEESREVLGRFMPWPHVVSSLDNIAENMQQAITNREKFEGELRYTLICKDTERVLGVLGLTILDKTVPSFEIGYWLRNSAVGKGYMTEAVKLVEHYAFETLNANRIQICMADKNLKSRAIAERCGYNHEATLLNARRLPNGELGNTLIYCKLPA